jgi:hypothetical protein
MTRTEELARRAAAYWTNFLREPAGMVFNNGDEGRNGRMAQILFNLGKKKHPDEKIDKFEELLFERLMDPVKYKIYELDVDYHPDTILTECLKASLVEYNSMAIFPCKTWLNIDWENNKLTASEGYHGERKEI